MGPVTKAEALRATIDIARDNVMQRIFGNLTERVAARERYSTPEAFADTAHRRMFTDARVEGRRSDMTRERVGSIADMRAHAELVRQRVAENPVEEGAAGA
jgi:hypothetical protein